MAEATTGQHCPVRWDDEVGCVTGRIEHACSRGQVWHVNHSCVACNASCFDEVWARMMRAEAGRG